MVLGSCSRSIRSHSARTEPEHEPRTMNHRSANRGIIIRRVPLTAGTRLGAYEIIASLGAGGMGEVYTARDTRLDRIVAVKVLSGALAADAESRQRFEQEARSSAALHHPHSRTNPDVRRHAATVPGQADIDYLVMELIEGETLAERLKKGPLAIADALDLAIQIGDALTAAHRVGIAHRDLNPGNVILVRRGTSGRT